MMQEIPHYESMKENIRGIQKATPEIKIEHSDNSSKIDANFLDMEMNAIDEQQNSRDNSLNMNQKTAERLNQRI